MELTKDKQISLFLSKFISIDAIRYKIIYFKNEIEKKEALDYHIERWETISSKYFRSFEKGLNYSYAVDSKYYITEKDRCLEFYNETGISSQVRDLLLDILNCYIEIFHEPYSDNILSCTMYEWREEDDKIYSNLANEIMKKFKE